MQTAWATLEPKKFAEGLKAKFMGNEDYKILSRSSFTSQIDLECQIPSNTLTKLLRHCGPVGLTDYSNYVQVQMPAMVQGSSNEVPSSFSLYTKVATTCRVNLSFDHFASDFSYFNCPVAMCVSEVSARSETKRSRSWALHERRSKQGKGQLNSIQKKSQAIWWILWI